jgi:hypothetical protein
MRNIESISPVQHHVCTRIQPGPKTCQLNNDYADEAGPPRQARFISACLLIRLAAGTRDN